MRRLLATSALMLGAVIFAAATPPASGAPLPDSEVIRLKDGSRWRGEISDYVEVTYLDRDIEIRFEGELEKVADLYIIVRGDIAGAVREKTIFRDDIVSMRTKDGAVAGQTKSAKKKGSDTTTSSSRKRGTASSGTRPQREVRTEIPRDANGKPLGVFLLPLEGGVGETLRHDEIDMMAEHADSYGPGQIIILKIRSNGGLVLEAEFINESIEEMRKRHRVIAWIDKAVSAGCSTAMSCDEIYFQTGGIAGSVTTIRSGPGGAVSVPEAQIRKGMEHMVELAKRNGHSEHIARAMKLNKYMCSYDKDPVTGEVTFYGDLSGEFVLSDETQNLCFNADNALHCGFSSGTADTEEDLAKLLHLPGWYEIDDYGRKIAKEWQDTFESVNYELRRIQAQLGYKNQGTGDPVKILGGQIQLYRRILKLYDRAEFFCEMNLGPRERFERELVQLRKQLADLKRSQRGR